MSDKPNDVAKLLRQLSSASKPSQSLTEYPQWFQERWTKDPECWSNVLAEAAQEVEQLQALAGRLYKQIYG